MLLARALHEGHGAIAGKLAESAAVTQNRMTSPLAHAAVQARLAAPQEATRAPYAERRQVQSRHLNLPVLPVTTISLDFDVQLSWLLWYR